MKFSPLLLAAGTLLGVSFTFVSSSDATTDASANAENGKALYQTYCVECHGINGDGNGVNAPHLSVQPRDHTGRAEMSARTDADLFKSIKEGGQAVNKSILMPNWDGNMSDQEIHDVVAHLRELCCD